MQKLKELNCLLIQTQLFWADPQANRNHLEDITRDQGSDCDLVVFPETFTSGFLGDAELEPETMDGPTVEWMKALASELDCVICAAQPLPLRKVLQTGFYGCSRTGRYSFMTSAISFPTAARTVVTLRVMNGKSSIIVAGAFARRFATTCGFQPGAAIAMTMMRFIVRFQLAGTTHPRMDGTAQSTGD